MGKTLTSPRVTKYKKVVVSMVHGEHSYFDFLSS